MLDRGQIIWEAKYLGGKIPGRQNTWEAKDLGAKDWGANDRGAKDQGAKDQRAKDVEPTCNYVPTQPFNSNASFTKECIQYVIISK